MSTIFRTAEDIGSDNDIHLELKFFDKYDAVIELQLKISKGELQDLKEQAPRLLSVQIEALDKNEDSDILFWSKLNPKQIIEDMQRH